MLWDPVNGSQKRAITNNFGFPRSIAWSRDSKALAVSNNNIIRLLNAENGNELRTLTTKSITSYNSLAWNPTGKILASAGDDKAIYLWNVTSGKLLLTLKGHEGSVTMAVWSPDGKNLASASQDKPFAFGMWRPGRC